MGGFTSKNIVESSSTIWKNLEENIGTGEKSIGPGKVVLMDEEDLQNQCMERYPWRKQVGGSHYKQFEIEPFEFFYVNNIPHHKATIIRRILRYDHPTGGGLQDLEKIKHEVDLIIDLYKRERGNELG